jgi:hypothetical protein
MPDVKIGVKQVNNPAPLWYRRLSNASIIFIIPGAIGLVSGWGLPVSEVNHWLMALGFAPAVFKGVGVILGDGSYYNVPEDKFSDNTAVLNEKEAIAKGKDVG